MEKEVYLAADRAMRRRTEAAGIERFPKRKGELAELAFTFKAASLGLAVCKPYGDSLPFDFIVQRGRRSLRVQVKSTFRSIRAGHEVGMHGPDKRPYTAEEVDFIAAYIVPHDAWYIIPIEAIGGRKTIRLYPKGSSRAGAGRFEEFFEAWHLLSGIPEETVEPEEALVGAE